MTTLSVLVPTYFHGSYLDACVTSALSARCAPSDRVEVVVLDDGSTDDTPRIGKELARRFPGQCIYKWQSNTGNIPRNMNTLAEIASGDLLLFFAGDDAFPKKWDAASRMTRFAADPTLAVTFCQGGQIDANGQEKPGLRQSDSIMDALEAISAQAILDNHLRQRPFQLFLQGTIVRRSLFEAVEGYDENVAADDTAMAIRLFEGMVAKGQCHGVDRAISFLYRTHGSNLHLNHERALSTKLEFYRAYIDPQYHGNFAKKILYNLERMNWSALMSAHVRAMLHDALEPSLVRQLWRRAILRKIIRCRR